MDLYYYSRSQQKLRLTNRFRQAEGGQAVVEYILMLIIACGIAALVVRLMVSQSADSPGFVIKKWSELVTAISSDATDDTK